MNRAVAFPFAPGIAWRSHGPIIAPILHQILQQWWGTAPPFIPQHWRDGWMILLGKPMNPPTSYYNLRPIALQDPVGKALMGLLIQCACSDARPTMLPWPLWAFMPMRSTLDAICRVSHHCHQVAQLIASQRPTPHARALGLPMFQFCGGVTVMLDLERAFDGVSREKLFGQLHTLNIPIAGALASRHPVPFPAWQRSRSSANRRRATPRMQGCPGPLELPDDAVSQ